MFSQIILNEAQTFHFIELKEDSFKELFMSFFQGVTVGPSAQFKAFSNPPFAFFIKEEARGGFFRRQVGQRGSCRKAKAVVVDP